jgi:hypothetical protein
MGIGKGNVSHNAVLADLDLGVGSLRQRAVYNRVKKTGGNMSLSEHRGVACGAQLNGFSVDDPVATDTHTGYGGYFPGIASRNNYISGNKVVLSARYSGGGGALSDGTSEHRTNFKVTESGQYRITGTVDWKGENTYYATYFKVCVVTSARGYMQGPTQLVVNYDPGIYVNDGIKNLNESFNLDTGRRFGTMVFYAVSKAGGNSSLPESVAKFYDFKVVKT